MLGKGWEGWRILRRRSGHNREGEFLGQEVLDD